MKFSQIEIPPAAAVEYACEQAIKACAEYIAEIGPTHQLRDAMMKLLLARKAVHENFVLCQKQNQSPKA